MRKKFLLLMGVFSIGFLYAQIGINTDTPLALFHIDAKNNTTSSTVGINDDVVVDQSGNLGIGTVTPPNKVAIVSTGTNTGLHIPNGAQAGNTLTSDAAGNAVWQEGKVQYQTVVYGNGANIYVNSILPVYTKITAFNITLVDKAKDIYGAAYGWDDTKQQYTAPVTGIYRIAYQVYFRHAGASPVGTNYRAYPFRNGSQYIYSGITSVTDTGSDIAAYTMGITPLNKGDVIDLRVGAYSSTGKVNYYAGVGHSFLIIESLN